MRQEPKRSEIKLDDPRDEVRERPIREWFSRAARTVASAAGSPWAFGGAGLIVLTWIVSGPILGYSETWQLSINTFTTIVTFLMVFLIQSTQNKDTNVIHVKLNELIAAQPNASNYLIDLEDMTDADLERLRIAFRKLADRQEEKAKGHPMSVNEVAHAIDEERTRRSEAGRSRRKRGHSPGA